MSWFIKCSEQQHVFVYGTLKDDAKLEDVLGHEVSAKKTALPGYKKVWKKIDAISYPTLEKDESSSVKGEIFLVTSEDLKKLDNWETHYRRKQITCAYGTRAFVYLLNF